MQLAAVEFARNVAGISGANSEEFDVTASDKIIEVSEGHIEGDRFPGKLRLGLHPARLQEASLARQLYGGQEVIQERHRHRYEFNNDYRQILENHGLVFSGINPTSDLVEIIELKDHPFFIATQFHPEFTSRPNRPQAIFKGFVEASLIYQEEKSN